MLVSLVNSPPSEDLFSFSLGLGPGQVRYNTGVTLLSLRLRGHVSRLISVALRLASSWRHSVIAPFRRVRTIPTRQHGKFVVPRRLRHGIGTADG